MLKFFRIPFATSGDKTAVPDAVDTNGNVSYTEGYGFDYQRQKTDPAAKNIERDKMNELFFDITTAIAELQSQGVPDFITAALNGGVAYSYGENAIVRWTDGDIYISLVAANTDDPTVPASWAPFSAVLKRYLSAVTPRSSNTILGVPDAGTLIVATGTFTQTFTAAATLGAGWQILYRNDGSGAITLDPNGAETIDSAATVVLDPGQSCLIVCTGAGFVTIGRNTSTSGSFTITGTGFSGTAPSATATYKIIDGWVHLQIPRSAITGTSNATTFTLTGLPAAITPGGNRELPLQSVADAGAQTWASAFVSTVGTIALSKTGAVGGWTASGTKTLNGSEFVYKL